MAPAEPGRAGPAVAAGAVGGLGAGLLTGAFIGTAVAGPLLKGFSGIGEELGGAAVVRLSGHG